MRKKQEMMEGLRQLAKSRTSISHGKLRRLFNGERVTTDLNEMIEFSNCCHRFSKTPNLIPVPEETIREQIKLIERCNISQVARAAQINKTRLWRLIQHDKEIKLSEAIRLREIGFLKF